MSGNNQIPQPTGCKAHSVPSPISLNLHLNPNLNPNPPALGSPTKNVRQKIQPQPSPMASGPGVNRPVHHNPRFTTNQEPRTKNPATRPRPASRRRNAGLPTTKRPKAPAPTGPNPASRRLSPGLATTNDVLGRRLDLIHATSVSEVLMTLNHGGWHRFAMAAPFCDGTVLPF